MTNDAGGGLVRVLLVDDEQLIRSGFRYVLSTDPGIEIIGEAAEGETAIRAARTLRPDVVLMDVRMPGIGGVAATMEIVAFSEAKVLAVTSIDSEDQLVRMLAAGAGGYLLKDEPPDRIIDAVRRTAQGDAVLSSRSAAQLIRRAVESEGESSRGEALGLISVLTDRERQVGIAVARGDTNQEIGLALYISAGTVKTHLEQISSKLGVRGRVQMGVLFARAGLI